jgi:peptide-methionine (S)-S-oxide reductase
MKELSKPRESLSRAAGVLVLACFVCSTISSSLVGETVGKELNMVDHVKTETATLGGGCFWCLEAIFERVPGVLSVTAGYAGGSAPHPTYQQVCEGNTGHAEVIQMEYDPKRITYEQILELFWQAHDPTTKDRQGPDVGTQYRSIILYHSDAQRMAAEKSKAALVAAGTYTAPVVTEIVPLKAFYKAEEYHQDYFQKNPKAPYCTFVIAPKLKKLKIK